MNSYRQYHALAKRISIAASGGGVFDLPRDPWHKSLTATDISVYGLLLGLGALQFSFSLRNDDFVYGGVTYFELARSIIEKGFYDFDFKPETML